MLVARHVIWDWNGTLFDDIDLVIAATNVSCAAIGGPVLTTEEYRRHQIRPITLFYERVMGREITVGEWEKLTESFYGHYGDLLHEAELAIDAISALDRVAAGGTQSLLSMWMHDRLLPLVEELRIGHYFERIDGSPGPTGESKISYMSDHVARLEESLGFTLNANNAVVIGDTADDGNAAFKLGLSAVMVTTGSSSRSDLEKTGWPVSDSLLHAVELAGYRSDTQRVSDTLR